MLVFLIMNRKVKILFICHGNICRSTMAEFIMKDLVKKSNLESFFEIASAATSREEIGNDIYPPAKAKLRQMNVPFERHRARQVTLQDAQYYDYLLVMDYNNLRNLNYITDGLCCQMRFPEASAVVV